MGIDNNKSTKTRSAKFEGMAIFCFVGIIAAIPLYGLGHILGSHELKLGGLVLPFLAPLLGLFSRKGRCPYCGTNVLVYLSQEGATCHACKKQIVIRDKKFILVE